MPCYKYTTLLQQTDDSIRGTRSIADKIEAQSNTVWRGSERGKLSHDSVPSGQRYEPTWVVGSALISKAGCVTCPSQPLIATPALFSFHVPL